MAVLVVQLGLLSLLAIEVSGEKKKHQNFALVVAENFFKNCHFSP